MARRRYSAEEIDQVLEQVTLSLDSDNEPTVSESDFSSADESVSSSPERSASPEIGDAADDVEGMESTEAATGGTEDTSAGDEAMSLKSHVEAVEVLAAGDDGSEGELGAFTI